jgi:hypothetical protein
VNSTVRLAQLMLTGTRRRGPGNRLESLFQMEARDIDCLRNLSQHNILRWPGPSYILVFARRRRVKGVTSTRLTESRSRAPSIPLLRPCNKRPSLTQVPLKPDDLAHCQAAHSRSEGLAHPGADRKRPHDSATRWRTREGAARSGSEG